MTNGKSNNDRYRTVFPSRRNVLKTVGGIGIAGSFAGCLGNGGDGGDGDTQPDTEPEPDQDGEPQPDDDSDEEEYPTQPITNVIPYGAGGGTDTSFRLLMPYVEEVLPEDSPGIVIDNRPGAGGMIGAEHVYNSDPDGYTLLTTPNDALLPAYFEDNPPYEPEEFTPISHILDIMYAFHASAGRFSSDWDTFVEELREAEPIVGGAVGTRGSSPMALVSTLDVLDIEFDMVPYDSGSEVAAASASGDIDVGISAGTPSITGMADEDRIDIHLLISEDRLYEDIPILDDISDDIPLITFSMGTYGPPDLDDSRVETLEEIFRSALELDEAQEELTQSGLVPRDGTTESLEDFVAQMPEDAAEFMDIMDRRGIEY